MSQRTRSLGNDPFQRGAAARTAAKTTAQGGLPRDEVRLQDHERELVTKKAGVKKAGVKKAGVQKAGVQKAGVQKAGVKKAGVQKADATANVKKTAAMETAPKNVAGSLPRLTGLTDVREEPTLADETAKGLIEKDPSSVGPAECARDYGPNLKPEHSLRPLVEYVCGRWFRLEARGIENVPPRGPALLVCNHGGAFPWDALMVKAACERFLPHSRNVHPLVEELFFGLPLAGSLLKGYGAVRACPENAERLLSEGALLAAFPEGLQGLGKSYFRRYALRRFGRGGFVKLSLRSGAPIVPVSIVGGEDAHPVLFNLSFLTARLGLSYLPVTPTFPLLGPFGLIPMPVKWLIEFGEPIDLSRHGPRAASDRVLVTRLSERVRGRIQEGVGELRKKRRGLFF